MSYYITGKLYRNMFSENLLVIGREECDLRSKCSNTQCRGKLIVAGGADRTICGYMSSSKPGLFLITEENKEEEHRWHYPYFNEYSQMQSIDILARECRERGVNKIGGIL